MTDTILLVLAYALILAGCALMAAAVLYGLVAWGVAPPLDCLLRALAGMGGGLVLVVLGFGCIMSCSQDD